MNAATSGKQWGVACKPNMTPDTNIDYRKSLQTNRLQIRTSWLEYLDTAGILMLAAGLVVYPFLMYRFVDKSNPNNSFIGYVLLPISILFGVLLFYKKLKEKRLIKIDTGFDKTKNKSLTLEFIKVQGYKVVKSNNDMLIAVREGGIASWPRQINVLFDTGVIYACVLTLSITARAPSFFTAKSIIKDLQKFLTTESLQATSAL
jgi:hypothetical protein